jgi:hypothetical protein
MHRSNEDRRRQELAGDAVEERFVTTILEAVGFQILTDLARTIPDEWRAVPLAAAEAAQLAQEALEELRHRHPRREAVGVYDEVWDHSIHSVRHVHFRQDDSDHSFLASRRAPHAERARLINVQTLCRLMAL